MAYKSWYIYIFIFYKHIVRVNCEVGTVLVAGETKTNKIWCLTAGAHRLEKRQASSQKCAISSERDVDTAGHTSGAVHSWIVSNKKES